MTSMIRGTCTTRFALDHAPLSERSVARSGVQVAELELATQDADFLGADAGGRLTPMGADTPAR
jgi:hypothetical protein